MGLFIRDGVIQMFVQIDRMMEVNETEHLKQPS
jgi:hypothetical protein